MTDETPLPPPPPAAAQYAAPQYAAVPASASTPGAPQYAATGYAQPPGGPNGAPTTPTNVLAVISLISSILGLFMIPLAGSIAGVVLGHLAKKQIAVSGEQGLGMAKAGLIIGYVALALAMLIILAYVAIIIFAITADTSSSY